MKRRLISSVIVLVVIVMLATGGILLYNNLRPQAVHGQIDFGTKYYLSEIRDNVFDGVTINQASYFLINEDQQTGQLHLVGLADDNIDFIVTKYTPGPTTTLQIEYIYKNELQKLTATSDDNEIRFKQVQPSRVDITQENPDGTRLLYYEVTILVFAKEVA